MTTKVLLGNWNPRQSRRAGLNPDVPLARCVCAFLHAFGKIGDPRGMDSVQKLEARHGKLKGVRTAAATARTALKSR